MKKSSFVAASLASATATATAISASSSSKLRFPQEDVYPRKKENSESNGTSSSSEKFAPRFDGLRFIETLVTAHR
ncbi:hypothetical protein ACJIZ3_010737 [Penstemon smallii]|uniref:Uncharacterized protein n=1 Tax=Penstemon smallii TaxID=265156 RepID=A0ABD3UHF8_9LAMI